MRGQAIDFRAISKALRDFPHQSPALIEVLSCVGGWFQRQSLGLTIPESLPSGTIAKTGQTIPSTPDFQFVVPGQE
jgi:hypothetical protein